MRGTAFMLVLAAAAACGDPADPKPDCADLPDACRAVCAYGPGDKSSLTLADFPKKIPIDHFVLLMQENRTFDHYFSSLTVPGQTVDGAPPDATNLDPTGVPVSRFHQTSLCFDNPAESWDQVHREVNGGAMDHFAIENGLDDPAHDPTGARAMGYYEEGDLPYYYALARAFAISDRHFAAVQSNSWTNRLFYMAGTSYGVTTNVVPTQQEDSAGNILANLFTRLDDAKVTWSFYVQDVPSLAILDLTWSKNISHVQPFQQFFDDAAAGKLAQVVFVEGTDLKGGVSPDEDPPADPQVGEAMVKSIIDAVMTSPEWPSSAVLLTYDEQGGFYDHVPPQPACAPDDFAPQLDPGGFAAQFDQTGLRVPLIAISPYAKRGYVSHVVTDHTSLLRLVEARFGLPALTRRDANAVPPFDLFDFDNPDPSIPSLPDATIDATQQMACTMQYPPK